MGKVEIEVAIGEKPKHISLNDLEEAKNKELYKKGDPK
jgi:hypothetical protein